MKKVNKTRILMWIVAIAPLVLVAVTYNRLPDKIPTNWSVSGEIAYGSKTTLWWLAGISPVLAALLMAVPKIDPRKRNYEKFRGFYDAFAPFIMVFLFAMVALIISESLNPGRIPVAKTVTAGLGLLYAFIGNIMPKFKSNFFIGIKTPWTLSSDEVWKKTHRLGGFLFFFGGIATVIMVLLVEEIPMFIGLGVITAAAAIGPVVMSYVWYKRLPPEI